ncbi:DUF1631 family protein [Rhizobacter sp. Root1221]|uniref:DUF1631 family protein n=1 Tax=Rhizobacter sp. Root1221 TaxID=1736433 RepID=UPI0009EBABCB|nr:DUF1631 family protein [Rhizobacter sp. Root1221]
MADGKLLRQMFDACRTDLEEAAERWREETIGALDAAQSSADSMVVASRLFHAQRALDRSNPFLPRRFVQLLESSMVERLGGPVTPSRRRPAPDELALVDDDVVTESIEVSRIVARIALEAEWEIREAEDALSRQLGRTVNGERSSPFHPEAFARTVWLLTEEMTLGADERAACLRAALGAIAALAKSTYACAVAWCGRAAASPSFVIKRSDSQATVSIPVDVSLDREFTPTALRAAALSDGAPATTPANDPPVLEARDLVFKGVIAGIEDILSDARFTPELKRVLSGLQMALMRFALGSPETLYAPGHRLWSVVRTLADYALNHCLRDRTAHDDFILFADDRIQTLLQLHEGALGELMPHLEACEQFVRTRPDQLIDNEATAMQHFARLENSRRKILGVALNRHRERISRAIGHTEMPFRLRQFLLADWAEVLARTELSEGPDSGCYGDYWQAAQLVISKMRLGETSSDDDASADDIAPLLATLERGMASIAVPSVEKHELASAFLRPGRRVSPDWLDSDYQDPTAALGRRTPAHKDMSFWGVREAGQPAFSHSTAGLTSAMPASDADHWINSLREGMVIELFLLGTWFDARVTSIDANGSLFTFDDEQSGRAHSLTRRALLRLVREGLAGPQ